MSDPIFVRTRHVYASYDDLWRLIELAGFPVCYMDEIDATSDQTYIIPTRNGECGDGWHDPHARILHLNIEWCDYPPLPGIRETLACDLWFAEKIGARYFMMGSDRRLRDDAPAWDSHADVAYLGYMIPRRQRVYHDLWTHGVSLSSTSAWGHERHAILSHARLYLHVHQLDDAPGVPCLRTVVAAAYALPFVTEAVARANGFSDILIQSHYTTLVRDTVRYVRDASCDGMLTAFGNALQYELCDRVTFRKSIEQAL